MRSVKDFLGQKQAEEIGEYALSPMGLLGSFATGATGMPDNTMQYLRLTGEWNSKTAEDYVEMCRERIAGNKDFTSDLALLASEWRKAVVAEIGREHYNSLSAQLGGDLAYAYVDYRMEQMMVDRMVKEQMPKSSVEYVLRKGLEGSLFGFADSLMRSPLQQEIDTRGEAAYNPLHRRKVGRAWRVVSSRCRGYRWHYLMGGIGRNGGAGSRLLRRRLVFGWQEECCGESTDCGRVHQPCRVRNGGKRVYRLP